VLAARRGLVLADSLQREPVLIVQLIALTTRRLSLGLVRDLLSEADLDEATLLALQREVEMAPIAEGIHGGLLGEMKVFHQLFRDMDTGQRSTRVVGGPTLLERALPRWLVRPLLRENLRFYLQGMDRVLAYRSTPRHHRAAAFPEDPFEPNRRWYHVLAWMMVPDMGQAIDRGDLGEASVAVASTALALRRYRLAEDAYPVSLHALVPDYLRELPVDPFTGEPVSYVREGEGFLLTSEGEGLPSTWRTVRDHVLRWRISR
jgi:hypothetical protein